MPHAYLIVGSDAHLRVWAVSARSGDVETVIYSVTNGSWQRFTTQSGASDPSAFYATTIISRATRPARWKIFGVVLRSQYRAHNYWETSTGPMTLKQLFD